MCRVTKGINSETRVRCVTGFPAMIRHNYVCANLGQHLRTLSDSMAGAEEPG